MKHKKVKNNQGFSLVELIIVIAILAILAGFLAAAYVKHLKEARAAVCLENRDRLYKEMNAKYADGTYDSLKIPCGHTCFDMLTAVLQGSCAQGICLAHAVQLFRIFDLNHDYASKAFMTSAVVSSMEGQNLISASLPRVR